MTNTSSNLRCEHETGPWPVDQKWPTCLKCEVEQARAKVADLIKAQAEEIELLKRTYNQLFDAYKTLESKPDETTGKGYCRRCNTRHNRLYCPDCGLWLIPAAGSSVEST